MEDYRLKRPRRNASQNASDHLVGSAAHPVSLYLQIIAEAVPGLTRTEYREIENIMRQDIFHSTLDWQTKAQLQEAAALARSVQIVLKERHEVVKELPLKRLATLTPEEDAAWNTLFAIAATDGASDNAAAHEAWIALQEQFPRLRHYDGCHAKPANP